MPQVRYPPRARRCGVAPREERDGSHAALDGARLFGPYPEVEAALQDALRVILSRARRGPRRRGCRRHAQIDSRDVPTAAASHS